MFFARGKVLQKLQAVKCPVRKARTFIIAEEINGELVEAEIERIRGFSRSSDHNIHMKISTEEGEAWFIGGGHEILNQDVVGKVVFVNCKRYSKYHGYINVDGRPNGYLFYFKDLPDCTRGEDFTQKYVLFDVVKDGFKLKAIIKEIIGDEEALKSRFSETGDLENP